MNVSAAFEILLPELGSSDSETFLYAAERCRELLSEDPALVDVIIATFPHLSLPAQYNAFLLGAEVWAPAIHRPGVADFLHGLREHQHAELRRGALMALTSPTALGATGNAQMAPADSELAVIPHSGERAEALNLVLEIRAAIDFLLDATELPTASRGILQDFVRPRVEQLQGLLTAELGDTTGVQRSRSSFVKIASLVMGAIFSTTSVIADSDEAAANLASLGERLEPVVDLVAGLIA